MKPVLRMHIDRIICLCKSFSSSRSPLKACSLADTSPNNRSFGTGYPDPSLDDLATSYGQKATALWHAGDITGRPLSKYVNYASDQTTFEEMYGYEPWRQERLKGLKQKYDPNNRFGFYNPIV